LMDILSPVHSSANLSVKRAHETLFGVILLVKSYDI